MTKNYKILAQFIKDMSSETPDVETYMFVKDNIFKYNLGININSKALKSRMIEIDTAERWIQKEYPKKINGGWITIKSVCNNSFKPAPAKNSGVFLNGSRLIEIRIKINENP